VAGDGLPPRPNPSCRAMRAALAAVLGRTWPPPGVAAAGNNAHNRLLSCNQLMAGFGA
jgi:hypothetical protein